MSTLKQYATDFKKLGTRPYQAILAIDTQLDFLLSQVGNKSLAFIDTPSTPSATTKPAVPGPCVFSVIGTNGSFIISITNPQNVLPQSTGIASAQVNLGTNAGQVTILHELQSCSTLNFDHAGGVQDYGVGAQLGYEFQNANVTLFWRIRDSYDGVNWNSWQVYSSPVTCGPVGVWSGLLTTAALTQVNSANTPTTQPLTQSGTSKTIDVAASVVQFGSGQVSYNSGSVTPSGYGAWYVYCLDPMRLGGAVTYLASSSNPDVTANDAIVYFGLITTSSGGGGSGSGGGGGPCCVAEVVSELLDGTSLPQSQLRRGMVLKGVDGGPEPIERITLIPNVPCFSFEGANGLILKGCSSQHFLQYEGGGFDRTHLIISGNTLDTVKGPTVVTRTFIGHRTVYKLMLGGATKTYWTDGYASHNTLKG